MIVGVGMDLVKRSRIEQALERHGDRFLKRIFTDGERDYSGGKPHSPLHFAGMWAIKESTVKALRWQSAWHRRRPCSGACRP